VGVAQRMGGLRKYVTCHISEFFLSFFRFFLFVFFAFFQRAPRSHFLTDRNDLYAKTRVFGQGCAFWGLDNIRLRLAVKPPKKLPQNSY